MKKNILNYHPSKTARLANYEMLTYIGIDKLPYFFVYKR